MGQRSKVKFFLTDLARNDLRYAKIWPLTFQGQISKAQNEFLEIAFLSAGLFSQLANLEKEAY